MYVLKSDSLFKNERFFASVPCLKFVHFSKYSVSKKGLNSFERLASMFQNVHISRGESLTLKKTPWQIQLTEMCIFQIRCVILKLSSCFKVGVDVFSYDVQYNLTHSVREFWR